MTTGMAGVDLSHLPRPAASKASTHGGPPVPPAQRIYFYSSGDWEDFIAEWARGLEDSYVQIKRLGGTGDQGIDVAAFKTEFGLEGAWDCFQGKHYARELRPADAYPEMLKVFLHVDAQDYVMPDSYQFLAPKGCGGTLNRLLSKPTKLRAQFIAALDAAGTLTKEIDADVLLRIRLLSAETDFSMFRSIELLDALETHSRTKYHHGRFGGPVLTRSEVAQPPSKLGSHETNYVVELRNVYAEACADDLSDGNLLAEHPKFGDHFKRQRLSFYSAEALRMDVRDSVPDGTFESLQGDVHAGVIEIVDAEHSSAMVRLTAALNQATLLDLSAHSLVSVARPEDRKGICHQLANDSRLGWARGARL